MFKPLNLETVLAIVDGEKPAALEFIDVYLESQKEQLKRADLAVKSRDLVLFIKALHELRGTILTLELKDLCAVLKNAEVQGANGNFHAALEIYLKVKEQTQEIEKMLLSIKRELEGDML